MVRVIDPTPDKSVVKVTICQECGVKLEYVPNDIKSYDSRDYTGDVDTYYYIACPNCGKRVYVTRR